MIRKPKHIDYWQRDYMPWGGKNRVERPPSASNLTKLLLAGGVWGTVAVVVAIAAVLIR